MDTINKALSNELSNWDNLSHEDHSEAMKKASLLAGDKVLLETFFDDGSVSAWFGGYWLCNEPDRGSAKQEAKFILSAIRNGAYWATKQYPGLVGKV